MKDVAEMIQRATNSAATAAESEVLEYAHSFHKREDYEPLEDLAHRVKRAAIEAAVETFNAAFRDDVD